MKKFLKVFIVVLLVLAVVGVTCYFFFKKIKEKDNTTPSFATFLTSDEAVEFNTNLFVITKELGDNGDTRFSLLKQTCGNLDSIVFSLSTYNIQNNTQIKDEEISSTFKLVKNKRDLLLRMMQEYNLKKSSSLFDKKLGANDLYEETCDYLIKYANLANMLNEYVSGVNKNSDVEFNVFDVYINVVKNDFSETETISKLVKVKNSNNITKLNSIVVLDFKGLIINDRFSINVNKFNEYYLSCDKTKFAQNFGSNMNSVVSENQTANEKIATYYFKLVFGLIIE